MPDLQPSVLFIRNIYCKKTTGESGNDEIVLKIIDQGKEILHWGEHKFKDGVEADVSIAVKCSIRGPITVQLWEMDGNDKNEFIMQNYNDLNRKDLRLMCKDDPNGVGYFKATGEGSKHSCEYYIYFSFEKDPIPSVRIHGIKCETESAGCDEELIQQVADVSEFVLEQTSKVLKKSKSLRVKAVGKAFDVAAQCVQAIAAVYTWLIKLIEGDDDVYIVRKMSDKTNVTLGFFPITCPDNKAYHMAKGEICDFETYRNQHDPEDADYYRFPIDLEDVKIELRELDKVKRDISLGAIEVKHDDIFNHPNWNKASVEIAAIFDNDNREGEGAVYYICWSLGYEDWSKPAKFDVQQAIEGIHDGFDDEPEPEQTHYYTYTNKADMQTVVGKRWNNDALANGLHNMINNGHNPPQVKLPLENGNYEVMEFFLPETTNFPEGSVFQVSNPADSPRGGRVWFQFHSRGKPTVEGNKDIRPGMTVRFVKAETGWYIEPV